jgi:transcriptional regulator with XRE-family HTH domain
MIRQNISNNLRVFRSKLNLNQKQFAKPLGITGGYISKIEKGLSDLSESVLCLIEVNYRINRNWLKTGEGEPFVKEWLDDKLNLFGEKGGPIKEFTQDFKLQLEVIDAAEAARRKAAPKKLCKITDPSNTSTPSDSSKPPGADIWQDHLIKTRFILESKTGYANSLAANIESFYDAVVTAEKLKDHEKRLEDIEQQLSTGRGKVEDSDAAQAVGS